jgi:hypothetical protein
MNRMSLFEVFALPMLEFSFLAEAASALAIEREKARSRANFDRENKRR